MRIPLRRRLRLARDILLRGKDSLFVFVEVTVDPTHPDFALLTRYDLGIHWRTALCQPRRTEAGKSHGLVSDYIDNVFWDWLNEDYKW